MKKKAGIGRLLQIAGERSGFLILSGVLSSVSAALMLVPYVATYFILAELLEKGVDPSRVDGGMMIRWGIFALLGSMAGLVFLYFSSMASHIAAFRILYGLRVEAGGAHRAAPPWVPYAYVNRCRKEDNGAKCRKNRKFHCPPNTGFGECVGHGSYHVRGYVLSQPLDGRRMSDFDLFWDFPYRPR